ncbi:hypothetical protein PLESTM_000251200 [Pleodorina starrii]|nr:hypothetical protein PLESTM_000251200 [Pleodorina starrii]
MSLRSGSNVGGPDVKKPSASRRLWSVTSLIAYVVFIALPLWYNAVRVPRVALPHGDIDSLAAAVAEPLAAALPSTLTAYVVCPGPGYPCPEYRQLSGFAAQLGTAVLAEAGVTPEQALLVVRVLLDAPGSCSASSWTSPAHQHHLAARANSAAAAAGGGGGGGGGGAPGVGTPRGGSSCLDLVSSAELQRTVMGGQDREFDDWASEQLAGQDRPGNYHLFLVPDPWLAATDLPYGSVGRRRVAFVRYPASPGPTHGSVVRLASLLAAPAFASQLGAPSSAADTDPDPDTCQPLPLSAASQLHLSFSLCNAHPSPHDGEGEGGAAGTRDGGGGGGGATPAAAAAAAAFTWDFSRFEAQFVTPLKQVLSPAARLTVSSQVLYFTPGRVNGTWDKRRAAFVLPYSQLPFFVDSSWPLDPGRTGLPASAAGGGDVPYDVAAVVAGSRPVAVGEILTMPPPQAGSAARAAAAPPPPLLLPPAAAAALPPAVVHFVLYAPPPRQRPLVLLGPDGQPTAANSFRVPGWGMLQVVNQVPKSGFIVDHVGQDAMEAFAVELVSQLRSLLGLGPARRRLLRLVDASQNATSTTTGAAAATAAAADSGGGGAAAASATSPSVGRVSLLSALRTGLAPWEVDALVRRRVREDAAAAASTLAALARLLRQVPTMAVPGHVGVRVRDAVGALRRTLSYAAQGRYEEASRSAQEARSWAEAAFGDPALSSRLNVPDTHMVGVYLPFCLPAAVPLVQMFLQEVQRRRRKRQGAAVAKGGKGGKKGKDDPDSGSGSKPGSGCEDQMKLDPVRQRKPG